MKALTQYARNRRRRVGGRKPPDRLLDFIPWASPHLVSPEHLADVAAMLDGSITEPTHSTTSMPPQHGKTVLFGHHLARRMMTEPGATCIYITYGEQRSLRVSAEIKAIAKRLNLNPTRASGAWEISNGSKIIFGSVDGQITGDPCGTCMVLDDVFKNRREAESATRRRQVWDFFTSTANSRCHPWASIHANGTRWHGADLNGRLKELGHYSDISLAAINANGEALWPDPEIGRPLDFLLRIRDTIPASEWMSLYQQDPQPRGASLFDEAHYYESLPASRGLRYAIGVDLAYTEKTSADFSVAVVMATDGERFYVVRALRLQCEAPEFLKRLTLLARRYPGAIQWHCSGTEKGAGQFIKEKIPTFQMVPATKDKYLRAQNVSADWNGGRVLLPTGDAPGVDELLTEVSVFTGVKDDFDDMVDAMGSAHNALRSNEPRTPRAPTGQRRH